MNSQAPLTAAGSAPSPQAEAPGGEGGGEPPSDLGQELRQAGRSEQQLAEERLGVGGPGEGPRR